MLTQLQIDLAKECFRVEPPLTHQQLSWYANVLTFESHEDRSEWFSRAGYACVYGATARGIRAEKARFPDGTLRSTEA